MSNTKNAYEIRLDILKMANDNLWQEYCREFEKFQTIEMTANGQNQTGDAYTKACSFLPTPDKIKTYATELYKFVEQ